MQRFILIYRTLTIIGGDQHTESVRQTPCLKPLIERWQRSKSRRSSACLGGHTFLPETLRGQLGGARLQKGLLSRRNSVTAFSLDAFTRKRNTSKSRASFQRHRWQRTKKTLLKGLAEKDLESYTVMTNVTKDVFRLR